MARKATACVLAFAICVSQFTLTASSYDEPPLPIFLAANTETFAAESPFDWQGADTPIRSLPVPKNEGAPTTSLAGDFVRAWRETEIPPAPWVIAAPEPSGLADPPWNPDELLPPDGMPLDPLDGNPGPLPAVLNAVGNGVVSGEVSDATTLNPVAGAFVDVIGTGKTAETDASGKFTVQGLAPGTYTLEATKLGYFSETAVTTVLEGQPAEVRFGLRVKPSDDSESEFVMEEETIVGEYQESSQGNLFLELQATPNLTAGISKEDFKKNLVSDAGEAIAKVSGANIVDGKFAVVRGLADRYVTTTFNGAQISSAEPSRKAVQLDLFPTNVIESIVVDKTYRPDLSGDFGGGAINIVTRSFPEERILNFKTKVTYNDALDGKIYVHPDRDIGTFGDLGPDMPPSLETFNPDGSTAGFIDGSNIPPEEWVNRQRELHDSAGMRPVQDDSDLGYSHSLTFGDTYDLSNGMRFGLILSGAYSNGDSSNTSPVTNPVRSFTRDEYTRGIDWVGYASAALELNEFNQINATYMQRRSAEDKIQLSREIIDDEENLNYGFRMPNKATPQTGRDNDYGTDFIYYGTAWDISPLSRDLEIIQLQGNHAYSDRGVRLDWSLTDSSSIESRPHSTHFEFGTLDFSSRALADVIIVNNNLRDEQAFLWARDLLRLPNPETYNWETIEAPMRSSSATNGIRFDRFAVRTEVIPDDTREPVETLVHGRYTGSVPGKQTSNRRTEKTEEDALHSQIALRVPFHYDDTDENRFEFGIGGENLRKTRKTTARQYDLFIQNNSAVNPGYPNAGLIGPGGRGEQIAANPNLISDDFTGSSLTGPFYLNALTDNGLENIDTRLDQKAWFLSGDLKHENIFLNGGIRYEKEAYDIAIEGTPLSSFTDEQIAGNGWENRDPEEVWLPSVSGGISTFEDRVEWLAGWSRTVARPTFYEFIPSITFDQANGFSRRGNNTLSPTEITNYDFAITYRPNEQTTFRTSFFYKDLLNPLVNFFDRDVLVYADSYIDANGQVVPFTGNIKGVEFEADITDLGPFSLRGNFTYIDAVLNYSFVTGGVASPVSSQLPYQPKTITNLNLGYDYEPWGLQANLIYNYTGEYPTVLKRVPEDTEIRRDAYSTLDFVLSKSLSTEQAEWVMRVGVKNLLDAKDTLLYGEDIFLEDKPGRAYFFEVEVSF